MTKKTGRLDKAVRIDSITIGERHRRIADDGIEDLALSIEEDGLLHPITLTEELKLVAGHRRLLACKLSDWETIPAFIFAYSPLEAELAEIRENLKRDDLTVLEHGQHLAREKEIYIELHPETKRGGDRKSEDFKRQNPPFDSYVDDAAKVGPKSERTIRENIKLVKDIDKKAQEDLKDTPTADKKGELKRIAKMPATEQRKVAKQLKSGKITKVPPKAPEVSRDTDSKLSVTDNWNQVLVDEGKVINTCITASLKRIKNTPGGQLDRATDSALRTYRQSITKQLLNNQIKR